MLANGFRGENKTTAWIKTAEGERSPGGEEDNERLFGTAEEEQGDKQGLLSLLANGLKSIKNKQHFVCNYNQPTVKRKYFYLDLLFVSFFICL